MKTTVIRRHRVARRLAFVLAVSVSALTYSLVGGAAVAAAAPTMNKPSPQVMTFGRTVTVTGTVAPVVADESVRVQMRIGGVWKQAGAAAVTDAAGNWTVTFKPRRSGRIRAEQLTGDVGTTADRGVFVRPAVRRARIVSSAYPYLGMTGEWRIAPRTYPRARIVAEIRQNGRLRGKVRGRVVNGRLRMRLPNPGVGRYVVTLRFPTISSFHGRSNASLRRTISAPSLGSGNRGMWVRSLHAGLNSSGIFAPSSRVATYSHKTGDAVIAFHKAHRKSRTSSFSRSDWVTMATRRIMPRYRIAATHIEVDKGRQVLMIVKNRRVWKTIHISSGSTGNTPAGKHQIQWKGLWVPSYYGSLLYRSMAFQGGYAIHGYPSVPTYPASHGCVRVPMWIADWLYRQTPQGQPVFVYESGRSTTLRSGSGFDIPELAGVRPGDAQSHR